MIPFIDGTIEKGVIFLLIFTPLAFGTVQQWSVAVMEIIASFLGIHYTTVSRAIRRIRMGSGLAI